MAICWCHRIQIISHFSSDIHIDAVRLNDRKYFEIGRGLENVINEKQLVLLFGIRHIIFESPFKLF